MSDLREAIAALVERYDSGDFDGPLTHPHTALTDAVLDLLGIPALPKEQHREG